MTVELDDDRFSPTCDRPMVECTVSKGVRVDVLMAFSPAAAPGHLRRIARFAFILAAVILGILALLGATRP